MRHLGKSFPEACRWLADENNVILTEYKPQSSAISRQTSFDASRYERFFERPWLSDEARRFLYDERRLDARVVRWCRLTSWRDREGTPWLEIPYYNKDGRLVGERLLVVGSKDVAEPKHLRYLHCAPWTGHLYNEVNLPLGAFHLDVP